MRSGSSVDALRSALNRTGGPLRLSMNTPQKFSGLLLIIVEVWNIAVDKEHEGRRGPALDTGTKPSA